MTRIRHSVPALALSISLLACSTVTPDEALQPIDRPANWASGQSDKGVQATEAPLPLSWVQTFADPQLDQLVLEAMNHNNDLGAAAARWKIARQSANITRSGLLPSLSASIRGNQDDSETAGSLDLSTGSFQGSRDSYSGTLSASWEADVWGRVTDGTRAAYRDAAASRADFEATRLSVAGAVAQSWYNLIAARLQRELAERDVESGEANLRITERRYERGVSSSLDVRLARSSLATSRASLISRQQTEQEATRALEVLLGRYPSAELKSVDALPTIAPLTAADGSIIGIGSPQSILERRPDIIAAGNRMAAEGLRTNQANKNILPSFQITSSAIVGSSHFADLFDAETIAANVAGTLLQPLFQGGRLTAQRRLQRAVKEQAIYNYVSTVLNAYSDVENALTAEILLAAREDALRLAFEEARASEELTERQYINGTRNIFNLINAQQRRIQNESQYIFAQQQRLNNRIALYLALGGTFDVGPEKFASAKPKKEASSVPIFRRWWNQYRAKSQ